MKKIEVSKEGNYFENVDRILFNIILHCNINYDKIFVDIQSYDRLMSNDNIGYHILVDENDKYYGMDIIVDENIQYNKSDYEMHFILYNSTTGNKEHIVVNYDIYQKRKNIIDDMLD